MVSTSDRKQQTRARIVRSATRRLRRHGISATSVAQVMKGAGLTVGGFYAHFPSKQALMLEALRSSLAETQDFLFGSDDASTSGQRLGRAVDRYLDPGHRDAPERGCALPASVGDAGQGPPSLREEIAAEIDALAQAFEQHAGLGRSRALATVALLVGGLMLARATRGTALSDEVLTACRKLGRGQV